MQFWVKVAPCECSCSSDFCRNAAKGLSESKRSDQESISSYLGFSHPVVFFQQKQEKGRIHLNLMLQYLQKDGAKGTVRNRDRWR